MSTWVVDLGDFLEEDGCLAVLPERALNVVLHLGAIVAWMTNQSGDGPEVTNVRCRRRPRRRQCVSDIVARFELGRVWDSAPRILWECPLCGDNGAIAGWDQTVWDRGIWAPSLNPESPTRH